MKHGIVKELAQSEICTESIPIKKIELLMCNGIFLENKKCQRENF